MALKIEARREELLQAIEEDEEGEEEDGYYSATG